MWLKKFDERKLRAIISLPVSLMGVSVRLTAVARVPPEGEVIIFTQTSNTELLSATVCIGKMVNEAAIGLSNSVYA